MVFPLKSLPYHYKIAIIYTLILFLDRIELTILNVALPTLTTVFNIKLELVEWFSISFLIGLAIAISISAWLGERFGYKRIFLFAVIGFGVFSLGCSLASSFETFIFSRLLQGLCGGIIIPSGNTLLYMACKKKDYAKITNFVFLPTLIAPAVAPYLGGTIIKYFSYKFIFYINLPICGIISLLSFLIIKENQTFEKNKFDFAGFMVSGFLYITFFTGVSYIGQDKILSAVPLLILAALLGFIFITIEKRQYNPMIDFSYFSRTLFRQSILIQLFFQMSHFGSFLVIGFYLQLGLGFSPQQTGIILAMQAVGAMIVAIPAKNAFYKYGPKLQMGAGLTGIAIITPLILLTSSISQLWFVATLMLSRGLCSGCVGPPLHSISLYDAGSNKADLGRMGSIFNIGRQLSISLGVCVSTLIVNITNFFLKFDYLHHTLTHAGAIKLFGGSIIAISIFSLMGAFITFRIDNVRVKKESTE